MSTVVVALRSLVNEWNIKTTEPIDGIRLAIGVLECTRTILESSSRSIDADVAKAYASTINHICRQRAHAASVRDTIEDERESHETTVRVFMYIIECQLRLALVQAKQTDALNDGTAIGTCNARVSECTFDAPSSPGDALLRMLNDVQTLGTLRDEAHNLLAYTVCFNDGPEEATNASWVHIEGCEVLTAHAWAAIELETLVESYELNLFLKEDGDDAKVAAWHARVRESQHTDEFLVEITDTLLKLQMYECESLMPETVRAYRESKPRKGYHWYTRLRVSREGDGCDTLYNACNMRTSVMASNLKDLSLFTYIEYYMRHAGVESWFSLCFVDAYYPKHALEALGLRKNLPVGYPKMPPVLYRFPMDQYAVITFNHALGTASMTPMESIHEAFATWCRIVATQYGGFLAPRISCESLIDTVFQKTDASAALQLNMVEETKRASTFALF